MHRTLWALAASLAALLGTAGCGEEAPTRPGLEAVDARGKVVASTDAYNESAEALGVPEVDGRALLRAGKVKPLAAGGEQRFRGGFMKDETPAFEDYRVRVVETPPVE